MFDTCKWRDAIMIKMKKIEIVWAKDALKSGIKPEIVAQKMKTTIEGLYKMINEERRVA